MLLNGLFLMACSACSGLRTTSPGVAYSGLGSPHQSLLINKMSYRLAYRSVIFLVEPPRFDDSSLCQIT